MVKPFYKFGDNIFRDELWKEYIVPVSHWFLMSNQQSTFLLPQLSGSVWECSLAIDFLIRVFKQPITDNNLREIIRAKVIGTARWLLDSLNDEPSVNGMSWDSAPWDTAVALRSLITCFHEFKGKFTDDEKKDFNRYIVKVCKWLLVQSKNWKGPDGYLTADTPDLAVTLSALIKVYDYYNNSGLPNDLKNIFQSIDDIARMLIQCVSINDKSTQILNQFNIENWGSCSNIGEVICALGTYIDWSDCQEKNKTEAEKVFLYGLKYIEDKQILGGVTDDSVADSCAIIWSYMSASQIVPDYGHNDIMVFRALCWMCDSNKVLQDGSFLHSSYVTVFYALSLILVYETWDLGKKSTNEVYHVVVWLNPNIEILERAKRLDLQLEANNYKDQIDKYNQIASEQKVKKTTLIVFSLLVIVAIAVLQLSKAITFIHISVLDRTLFFSILSASLVIVPSISKLTYSITKKYNENKRNE